MTAKQALWDLVDEMSEEKAADVLEWLEWEARVEQRPLSPAERAAIDRGLVEYRAGRFIDHEEIVREFRTDA